MTEDTVKKVAEAIREHIRVDDTGCARINVETAARAAISAMSEWRPMGEMPNEIIRQRKTVLLDDGVGVVAGHYNLPMTLEEWWKVVGEPDEAPDKDEYAYYLYEEPVGWCHPTLDGVEFITPRAWMPIPIPPEGER